MGCYAHLRKKAGKMEEIDLSDPGSKERLRSGAVLDLELFNNQISSAPEDVENELFNDEL
jgi:hypothetical protein